MIRFEAPTRERPYVGKDYIKDGYLVALVGKSWRQIDKRARWSVKKAQRSGLAVEETRDLQRLRPIYFKPRLLPRQLRRSQHCFLALNSASKVVAGVVIELIRPNVIYKYGAANDEGRSLQATSFLLWNVVRLYSDSRFKHLDLGTSYRSELDHFKRQFSTTIYPVIFNPPRVRPIIRLDPYFNNYRIPRNLLKFIGEMPALAEKFFGKDHTVVADGRTAIYAVLKHIGIQARDTVTIVTSFGTRYIASDVTDTIEMVCRHSRKILPETKALFLIHEWGFPVPDLKELLESARSRGIPVIEDCAHSISTTVGGRRIGTFGDYGIYSLSKIFPMQFGGILSGLALKDRDLAELRILDPGKCAMVSAELPCHLAAADQYAAKRVANFAYLEKGFDKIGLEAHTRAAAGVVPHAFLLRVPSPKKMARFLGAFGIDAGIYHYSNAILLPVHQNLSVRDLDYTLGAIKSRFL